MVPGPCKHRENALLPNRPAHGRSTLLEDVPHEPDDKAYPQLAEGRASEQNLQHQLDAKNHDAFQCVATASVGKDGDFQLRLAAASAVGDAVKTAGIALPRQQG